MPGTIPQTLTTLCSGLIDYAGMFPPSSLDLGPAAENYARYLRAEHSWMLGRFICRASMLESLSAEASILLPGTFATSGYREHADDLGMWRIAVVLDTELDSALDLIDAFNERHAAEDSGLARADTIELRAAEPSSIDDALDLIPEDLFPFFEIPIDADPRGYVAALAGGEAAAKVRCGGVRAEMIPSVDRLADFIEACTVGGVAFKATAGLHHPVRAENPLTYEPDPPRAVMHGFFNVFLGTALRRAQRIDRAGLGEILRESDPQAFRFGESEASWRDASIGAVQLADARERFSLSYGSCSFTEPIDDLGALGLL